MPTASGYHNYGGQGIGLCEQWKNSFENFYRWSIENGYYAKMILTRKDKTANFSPENCEWVERKKQPRGKRKLHYRTFEGETHSVSGWARIYGIDHNTLNQRLRRGWDFQKAVTAQKRNYEPKDPFRIDDYDMENDS